MKLFNKYKNKNFAFITNYINSCVNDDSLALTEEDIKEQLSGASQRSFEEFLLALTNACDTSETYNAAILYCQNDVMLPLRQIPIPVRASLAEKAWLYYILQNSKSDLFLEMEKSRNSCLRWKTKLTDIDILSKQIILIFGHYLPIISW